MAASITGRARAFAMVGQRFRHLIVLGVVDNGAGRTAISCRCDCGEICERDSSEVRRGKSRTCGCEMQTHGYAGRRRCPAYTVWALMRSRCNNINGKDYSFYGGRGITVCDRWNEFKNFFADMGNPPRGHWIERIDNDGNYEPGNCRWATRLDQARNRRNNRKVVAFGETKCLSAWVEDGRCRVGYRTLLHRLNLGWKSEPAITLNKRSRVPGWECPRFPAGFNPPCSASPAVDCGGSGG